MTTERDRERRHSTDGGHALVGAAFDALPAQVAVVDADGEILRTNRAWRCFGAENGLDGDANMVGENYLAVCDASDDESASDAAAGIRSVLAGDRAEFTLEYPCHSPEQRRWFLLRALALSESDEPRALVMHVDITDRKEIELRVRADNETLSTVANVLSHDLRNPLNVAMARAELLANAPDAGAETVAQETASIRSALERMTAIVDDALVLAHGSEHVDSEHVDIATIARDAWSHVETGDATLEIGAETTLIADASLLTQLFENLFRNAVEHSSTSPPSDTQRDAVEHADPGTTVTVGATADGFYVADDGPGIASADRDRVFDAGYSTGDGDANTGMGLAIVRNIAEAHGWHVRLTTADPEDGESGARFEFEGALGSG